MYPPKGLTGMIMKSTLILLLLCAFSSAMVPKTRVPRDSEKRIFCAPGTPCSWTIYNSVTKEIAGNIPNTYCICPESTSCMKYEDNSDVSTENRCL